MAVGILILGIIWVLIHALADDARPALGVRSSVSGTAQLTYYSLQPKPAVGKVETVVLVASLGRPVSDFNELVTALVQAGYRTIAVESRGIMTWSGGGLARYPLSDLAGDVRAVLADAGVAPTERVHVIGHAFGNRVARTFATLYPQQTASLVLVAAGDDPQKPPAIARGLRLSTMGFIPWSLRGDDVTKVFFSAGNEVPEYWQRGWSFWGALGQIRAATDARNANFSAGGTAPLLVLQAQDDVVAPSAKAGEALKASLGSRVELVMVPHAGHAFLPEQPEVIAHSIVAFLRAHAV